MSVAFDSDRLRRMAAGGAGTFACGAIVALASWLVAFSKPTSGLDPSWGGGLYMAVERGIPFGTDVVFTYGPLGFLINPVDWFIGLASIAYVWLAVLHVLFACALVWSLRRSFGLLVATLGSFIVLNLLPSIEVAFALAAIAAFAALGRDRPRWALPALIVGGALFAAIEVLVKLSVGPPVFAMLAVAVVGARARPWQIASFFGLFAAGVVGLWLLSGQPFGALPDYVGNGREIVSGYSEAMMLTRGSAAVHALGVAAALAALIALVAGAALAEHRDGLARWCAIAIAFIAGFSLFKEGVVRFDAPHLAAALSTMAVVWIALPFGSRRALAAVGALLMISVALPAQVNGNVDAAIDRLDATANVQRAFEQTGDLLDPSDREVGRDGTRALMVAGYDLSDEMLSDLEGQSVAIDPWEIATAWAYDLDWDPLPVFQGYQAYTRALDDLNAGRVASPEGPDRILRSSPDAVFNDFRARSIDGRYPAWDPPAQAMATLCNFAPVAKSANWQLLGRVPDRCSEPVQVGSVSAEWGEEVEVPQAGPGEVVFARVDGAGLGPLESLRALLYRARFRYALLDGARRYRLIPGTAADGLLLSGDPRVTGRGGYAQAPQAATIALQGASGDLRYDFYSMKVRSTPRRGGREPRG